MSEAIPTDPQNPEENTSPLKSTTQLDHYSLHQSFFTKQQLTDQHEFKIIKYESRPDSIEPVLHSNDVLFMGGTHLGLYHGWGILITKTATYEGKFSLGHKMGKGYMKFANNSVYVGDFTNDKPHGQGMMQLSDQYYIGDFENGAMQGDGLWRNNKHEKYVGSWKNNKAHGYGIYATEKSHYQGEFANFVKHGYGIQNFVNGDVYKGHYIHGKPHGKGQYFWATGATYKGEFVNGVREGEGVWVSENGDKYNGHFSNDRKNGPGEYFWSNGNSYKGNFSQDMREGEGQMFWNDGSTYSGEWQRGLPHGKARDFQSQRLKTACRIFLRQCFSERVQAKRIQIERTIPRESQRFIDIGNDSLGVKKTQEKKVNAVLEKIFQHSDFNQLNYELYGDNQVENLEKQKQVQVIELKLLKQQLYFLL